jgi:alpha-methylacyl-CoA racemase
MFKTRTRDEWCLLLEGTDACFAPVLTMEEAPHHPHNVARGSFIELDGVVQPGPAPRFGRTPAGRPTPPRARGEGARPALADWGIAAEKIEALFAAGVLGEAEVEIFDQKIKRDAKAGKLDRVAGNVVDDLHKGGREL